MLNTAKRTTNNLVVGTLFFLLITFLLLYEYTNVFTKYNISTIDPNLSQLRWIEGTWKNKETEQLTMEVWKLSSPNRFEGHGYMIEGKDTTFHENLTIECLNGDVLYIAQFEGQVATMFQMTNSEGNYLVFENKEHIYPQTISYNLLNDSTMIAALEGKNEFGEFVRREFTYTRADNN